MRGLAQIAAPLTSKHVILAEGRPLPMKTLMSQTKTQLEGFIVDKNAAPKYRETRAARHPHHTAPHLTTFGEGPRRDARTQAAAKLQTLPRHRHTREGEELLVLLLHARAATVQLLVGADVLSVHMHRVARDIHKNLVLREPRHGHLCCAGVCSKRRLARFEL